MASSQIPQDICCLLGTPTQVLLYNSSILQSVSRMWWHHHRYLRISAVSWVPQHRSYCIINLILQSISRMWWHHHRYLRISAVSRVPQHRSYCIIHLFFNLFLGCGGIITDTSGYLLSPGYPNTGLTV